MLMGVVAKKERISSPVERGAHKESACESSSFHISYQRVFSLFLITKHGYYTSADYSSVL
jgi:hypothetical protein